ncbi:TPA: SAP domain-containing protein [bacterium]|nr:SAP domain-containing protein [bacterium]
MKTEDVRKKAKEIGLKTGRMKKEALILAIQHAEGNIPCFRKGTEYCDRVDCCWREDCLS